MSFEAHGSSSSRRRFLSRLALGTGAFALGGPLFTRRGAFAEELQRTPRQTEGPFYPDELPLDTDNDLLVINDEITPAVGEITHLGGRIVDLEGRPIRNAVIEIWQVDSKGAYLHTGSSNRDARDANFQGYGRFLTGSKGEYYFRTVKPVPYPGRTPHIHLIVKKGEKRLLTSQLYIEGEPRNEKDRLYMSIADEKARAAVTIPFRPMEDSALGELSARADIVVGLTPEDSEERRPRAPRPLRERRPEESR